MLFADVLIDSQFIGFLVNKFSQLSIRVAPRVGAWIETGHWVFPHFMRSRAPRGRVD